MLLPRHTSIHCSSSVKNKIKIIVILRLKLFRSTATDCPPRDVHLPVRLVWAANNSSRHGQTTMPLGIPREFAITFYCWPQIDVTRIMSLTASVKLPPTILAHQHHVPERVKNVPKDPHVIELDLAFWSFHSLPCRPNVLNTDRLLISFSCPEGFSGPICEDKTPNITASTYQKPKECPQYLASFYCWRNLGSATTNSFQLTSVGCITQTMGSLGTKIMKKFAPRNVHRYHRHSHPHKPKISQKINAPNRCN